MSYSRPSRIAPSAIRMSLMSSTLNTSARIASPPGNTGRRSSVIGSSLSSRVWPASIEYSMARLIPAGVMESAWGSSARIESPIARPEPRLLHAGDDLDRMPERLAGTLEEGLLAVREAQRVRPHDAHAVGVHVAQPLAEALETGERPRRDFLIDAAVLGYPGREPHHLAQPIDDGQLAVRVTGHHHVKAVGT